MTVKVWNPELAEELAESDRQFLEWFHPFLMNQRQALLMQVASIEKALGIEPTTADLRKLAKCDRMVDKGEGP